MLTIVHVYFFVCAVWAAVSVVLFASIVLSVRRRRRANQSHSERMVCLAGLAMCTGMPALTGMELTSVEIWPSSAFSWSVAVLVNVLLQPVFLLVMKGVLLNLSAAFRGQVAYAGRVVPELSNLPPRERRRWLWDRTISGMVMMALFAAWSFACLSPFF
jgi:hypothetical protein